MTPCRIQRKRTKGWRMPSNTVYVGRPSKWGNPYKAGQPIGLYKAWVQVASGLDFAELRGKNLACWCPLNTPHCHADVLLELANS